MKRDNQFLSVEEGEPVTVRIYYQHPLILLERIRISFPQTMLYAHDFKIIENTVTFKVVARHYQLPSILRFPDLDKVTLIFSKVPSTDPWLVDYHLSEIQNNSPIIEVPKPQENINDSNKELVKELYSKCWKDKLALYIVINCIDRNTKQLKISNILNFMGSIGLFPRPEFQKNLTELLRIESNNEENISMDNFSGILARFGPIKLMRNKIDSFTSQNISKSYYGTMSADDANSVLKNFYMTHKKPGVLYRNTIPTYNPQEPNIMPVFSVSWIIEDSTQHLRVYVHKRGHLCLWEQRRINLWSEIMETIKEVKQIKDINFDPVVTDKYGGLVSEQYLEIREPPKFPDLDYLVEVDNDTGKFGFV